MKCFLFKVMSLTQAKYGQGMGQLHMHRGTHDFLMCQGYDELFQ